MNRNNQSHPVFTAAGCLNVILKLHVEASKNKDTYEREKGIWCYITDAIYKIYDTPFLYGSIAGIEILDEISTRIMETDYVESDALLAASHLAGVPVLDSIVYKSCLKDVIEEIMLREWPNAFHQVIFNERYGYCCVYYKNPGGIKGLLYRSVYGYPTSGEIVSRIKKYLKRNLFVKYDFAVVNEEIRVMASYESDGEIIDDSKPLFTKFQKDVIDAAWKASGNV